MFFTFVGEKCCNTTTLDPQQLKTVGVGLTFQPFVGATFPSFVGPTIFVSQQMKTVGVGGNYAPFVVALFTVGEPKSVGPTKFPQQKRESNSNTNSSYCW